MNFSVGSIRLWLEIRYIFRIGNICGFMLRYQSDTGCGGFLLRARKQGTVWKENTQGNHIGHFMGIVTKTRFQVQTFQEALLKPGNCVVFGPLVQHRKSSHGSYQATIPNKSHQNASGTAHQQSSVVSRMSKKVSTTSADFNVNIIRMGPDSCSSSRRASVDVPQFDFDLTPKRRAKNKADAMMGAVANMLRDSRKSTNPLPSEQRDSSLLQYSSPRCRLLVMVKHKAFEWTVTGCIILNTVLMAIQHPRMNKTMEQVSEIGNSVCVSRHRLSDPV